MPAEASTVEVSVAAPAALSWLTDPTNIERWHPLYRDVNVDGDDVRAILDFYGQSFPMQLSIEPGSSSVVLSGAGKRMGAIDRIVVEPTAAGCRVHYEIELSTRGALRPLNRGLTPIAERAAARAAKRLGKSITAATARAG